MVSEHASVWVRRLAPLVLFSAACLPSQDYVCSQPEDCDGAPGGVCLPDGDCAYPATDDACASGLQRSETATRDPGTCVPLENTTSSTSTSGTPVTTSGTTGPGEVTTTSTFSSGPASSSGATATGQTSTSTSGSSSETQGPQPVETAHEANVVGCLADGVPDPSCEPELGRFVVDGNPPPVRAGYVGFELPEAVPQQTLLELRLELTAPKGCSICEGESTGDVYAVEAFTEASLAKGAPQPLAILSPSVGPVLAGVAVEITLPTDALEGTQLFVSLVPDTANEVHFWSDTGLFPPRLIVVTSE